MKIITQLFCFLTFCLILLSTSCEESIKSDNGFDSTNNYVFELFTHPDSTVQISISDISFLYHWEVYKNDILMDTLWNLVWKDTAKSDTSTRFEVKLYNNENELIIEKLLSFSEIITPPVGIIIPSLGTKCILGIEQVVKWEPNCFPSESVDVRIKVFYPNNGWDEGEIKKVENNGYRLFFLRRWYGNKPEKVSISIMPSDHPSKYVYEYYNDFDIVLPNYSNFIRYPAANDTVFRGQCCIVRWDQDRIVEDSVYFNVRDKSSSEMFNSYLIANTGEYEWTVPNLESDFYSIELYSEKYHTLNIGFPFYLK